MHVHSASKHFAHVLLVSHIWKSFGLVIHVHVHICIVYLRVHIYYMYMYYV